MLPELYSSWNCDVFWGNYISPKSCGSPSTRERCTIYKFKFPLCKEKCSVGFRMMLQNKGDRKQDL